MTRFFTLPPAARNQTPTSGQQLESPTLPTQQAASPPTSIGVPVPQSPPPAPSPQPPQASQPQPPIRVLHVDDQVIMRNGIQFSLLAFTDIEVIAQADSGEEALELCDQLHPDIVLMDLIMPGMGGIATITALQAQWPEIRVIALTSFQEGSLVEEALQAGAIGYLLKDVAVDDLAKAIRLAQRGMPVLAAAAAQALVHVVTARPPKLGQDLTERERQVLGLLAEGLSNQQIADRLVITPATVKFHTHSIRSKLGASSRTEMVVLALQNHLV